MFRSLKTLICSTCAMLHVPKRMNWDPEYRKDRMWQNRIKISLLNVSSISLLHHGCSKTYYSQLWVFPQLPLFPETEAKRINAETKKDLVGDLEGKKKKKGKREGPVSTRKFAHPNLCTLGGAVCKLLQVPLQGIQLLGELPGLRGKRRRKGSWESNNRSRVLKKLFL